MPALSSDRCHADECITGSRGILALRTMRVELGSGASRDCCGLRRLGCRAPETCAAALNPMPERITIAPHMPARPLVRDGYLPLYTYLEHRYASTVVLTFEQIESLLGFALTEAARQGPGWWSSGAGNAPRYAEAWTAAKRTALPNLLARHVTFERLP